MTRREPHLSAEQRRALEILAAARVRGCTGAALLDHGFCIGMLADLVRDGLATLKITRFGNARLQQQDLGVHSSLVGAAGIPLGAGAND